MNRTINFPVVGGAADFAIERTDTGYDCLLNGVLIPSVISQKLVVEMVCRRLFWKLQ